jgi:hypothetical protein
VIRQYRHHLVVEELFPLRVVLRHVHVEHELSFLLLHHHRKVRAVQRSAGAGDEQREAVRAHEFQEFGAVFDLVIGRRVHRLFDEHHGLRGDAFAAAAEAERLGGGGLDVDRARLDAEVRGDVAHHLRHMRRHARRLREDGGVDVHHAQFLLA